MKFDGKKISRVIGKNLREMAMDKPQGFNPSPDIERALAGNRTSIPGSLMPQQGFNAPNTNFQELLASERYRAVVDRMREYLGNRAPRSMNRQEDMFPLYHMMEEIVADVQNMEANHKEELEQLAVDLVKKELGVPEGQINYIPHLVDRGSIPVEDFARNLPPDEEEQIRQRQGEDPEAEEGNDEEQDGEEQVGQEDGQQVNREELEARLAQALEDFDMEKGKRRLINALMQGASKRGHYMFHMVADEVQNITGSQDIINNYGILMVINDLLYWQFGDQLMTANLGRLQDAVGGKEKVLRPLGNQEDPGNEGNEEGPQEYPEDPENLAPQQYDPNQQNDDDEEDQENGGGQGQPGGEEEGDCPRHATLPTVCAWGVNFPILVHELLKGTYEIVGVHGQSEEGFEDVKSMEDTIDKELWDLRLGPPMWDRLRSLFPDEIIQQDNQKVLQIYLLMSIFKLPAREFLVFMKEALSKTDVGRDMIRQLFTGARNILREQQVYDEWKTKEAAKAQASKFQEKVKEVSDNTPDDDLKKMLEGLGIGGKSVEKDIETPKADMSDKELSGLGLNALNFELNKAIDAENWELSQRIQAMIDRKQRNQR